MLLTTKKVGCISLSKVDYNGKSIAVRWGLNVLLPHDSTKVN